MRILLVIVAVIALAGFVAVAFVLPQMQTADAREAAQALISGASGAQQQVAAAAAKAGKLDGAGGGIKVANKSDPKHGELKWVVSGNGAIRGWNEKNAIEVTLTPALAGGKVSWNCRGYPNPAMPTTCGGRS